MLLPMSCDAWVSRRDQAQDAVSSNGDRVHAVRCGDEQPGGPVAVAMLELPRESCRPVHALRRSLTRPRRRTPVAMRGMPGAELHRAAGAESSDADAEAASEAAGTYRVGGNRMRRTVLYRQELGPTDDRSAGHAAGRSRRGGMATGLARREPAQQEQRNRKMMYRAERR